MEEAVPRGGGNKQGGGEMLARLRSAKMQIISPF